jgi:hypothetical protein
VIVNAADPYSVEVGAYYARRRGIPPANVIPITLPTGQAAMSRPEFEVGKTQMEARLPGHVQALALAWTTPFRVDCLSIPAVNGSRPAADAATSDEPASVPLTLTGALRVSVLPRPADSVLLGRRYRAARENTGPEDSGQDRGKDLPHYSIT